MSVVNYSVFPKENVLERSKCKGNRFSGICLFVHNRSRLEKCCIEIRSTDLDDVKYSNNVLWCMIHSILVGVADIGVGSTTTHP